MRFSALLLAAKNRLNLWLILVALIIAPLLLVWHGERLSPLPLHLLILLAAGVLAFVLMRRKFAPRKLWARPAPGWQYGPLLRAGILALAAGIYAFVYEPDGAFKLMLEHPWFWMLIMILYPLLSVLPQEILFRVCLMDTLAPFPSSRNRQVWAAILGSAVLFGWAHVIYAGYTAMLSTCLAGLALGWNYHVNRSNPGALWPLLLEHSLYGQIVFTTGLGHYFYVLRSAS
jgi:hypothetical protein